MKMNRDDHRADEPAADEPAADEPGQSDKAPDPAIVHEQLDAEPHPRRIRLGAAWRLSVIRAAAAELDDEELDGE